MADISTVTSPTGQSINIVDDKEQGFNALDSDAFMKLLITQLQNQDPTEPTSNEQLLTQLSQMRSLQASVELEDTIKLLSDSQSSAATAAFASSSASLIGRVVTATTDQGETIEGKVDRAILRDGKAFVGIGDIEVPIENITSVRGQVATP